MSRLAPFTGPRLPAPGSRTRGWRGDMHAHLGLRACVALDVPLGLAVLVAALI